VWKLYFQRLNIWHQLLRNEVRRAQRFASKARCNSLLDEFIIHELERDVHISRLMLSETNLLSLIINFGKRLSQILELAQKIKMIPCDLELHHQQHVHDFMMRAENRLEKGRKHIRYINKRFAPKDKEFHEFLMTASNECGFSSETYFQAVRISEFVNLRRHPVNQRDKKFIAMLSIAVASSKTEKTGPSSSSLLEYFFEDALVAEQDCFRNLVDQSKEKLKYSWYHPSARMFLHNFLRMMKEEGSKDLVILANYFVHLLTGYTGTLSGFPAPSLIALGSMAAARQMLGLCYRHPETGGPVQVSDDCSYNALT